MMMLCCVTLLVQFVLVRGAASWLRNVCVKSCSLVFLVVEKKI